MIVLHHNPQIRRCTCCARQSTEVPLDRERTVTNKGAIADVNGAICVECAVDLDANGMFPGEGYSNEF